MRSIGLAALGLSLVTATAAYAQTTVTREVSEMPVETTITRSPSRTVITRRVLPTVTEVLPAQRTVVATRRPAYASARTATRVVSTRRAPVYAMVAAEPLLLSVQERSFLYTAIMDQNAPAVAPGGVYAYAPDAVPAVAVDPLARTDYDPLARTDYVVGSRLPRGIPLIELPAAAVSVVPETAPYAYALVNGRILLVDPQTGIIVADIG